jgi:hypothetical protein
MSGSTTEKTADGPPNDVLFLQPVVPAGEKARRGKVRMLYCDAAGRVYTSRESGAVYELAKEMAKRMARNHKPFAVIGLETVPGRLLPVLVEINDKESHALERISEHAASRGRLPYPLKKYLRPVLTPVGVAFEAVVPTRRKHRRAMQIEVTSRALEKLPGYPEHEIRISLPIYKAAYRYPLVVLTVLPADETTLPGTVRLLALDGELDLVVVRVPGKLSSGIGNKPDSADDSPREVAVLRPGERAGLDVNRLTVTRHQHQSLRTLVNFYAATGSSRQTVSRTAEAVIERAREMMNRSIPQETLS